jgi:renal tumor antigen
MKKYKLVCKKGEGTFSEVVKAENTETGNHYAIKCMKTAFDSAKQVSNLREIQALKRLTPHPNIISLEEVLYDEPSGRLAIVFELMEQNLYDMISGRKNHLEQDLIRKVAYQIFNAILHMHSRGIFHRDIKPENILVDPTGQHVKVADLGSCRSITSSKHPMTEYIATRWYRSPECLLTDGYYGAEMDIWGAGCVLFEITALFPLFPGADEIDQINRIHKVLGTPSPSILAKLKAKGSSRINYDFPSQKGIGIRHFISHAPQEEVDLLNQTLIYDYNLRIKAQQVLETPYFESLHEKSKVVSDHNPTRIQATTKVHIANTNHVQESKIKTRNPSTVSSPTHTQSSNVEVPKVKEKNIVSLTANMVSPVDSTKNKNAIEGASPSTPKSKILRAHPSTRISPTKKEQVQDSKPSISNSVRSPSSRSSTDATRKAATLTKRRVANNTVSSSPKARLSRSPMKAAATLSQRRVTPSVPTNANPSVNGTTTQRRRVASNNTLSKSTKPAANASTSKTTTTTSTLNTRRRVAPNINTSKTTTTSGTTSTFSTRHRVVPPGISKSKSSDDANEVPVYRRRVAPSALSKSKSHDETNTTHALSRRRIVPTSLSNSNSTNKTTSKMALSYRRRIAPSTKSEPLSKTSTVPRRQIESNTVSSSKSSADVLKSAKSKLSSVSTLANRRTAITNQNRSKPNHSLRKSPDSTNSTLPSLGLPARRRNKYSHVRSSGYGRTKAPKNVSAGTMETLTSSKSNSPGANSFSSQMSRGVKLPTVPV